MSTANRNWTIWFPDGTSLTASTAGRVIAKWGRRQWHTVQGESWREELVKRAYIWSSMVIDPEIPAPQFLAELAKAGLIKIERSN